MTSVYITPDKTVYVSPAGRLLCTKDPIVHYFIVFIFDNNAKFRGYLICNNTDLAKYNWAQVFQVEYIDLIQKTSLLEVCALKYTL